MRWNKKHLSSFLKTFHLPKKVSQTWEHTFNFFLPLKIRNNANYNFWAIRKDAKYTLKKDTVHSKVNNQRRRCSVRKGVLRNFAKFSGKHLCQSLLFKLQAEVCNFIKKQTLAQVFSSEFYEISKNTFFTEHRRATASE